MKLAWSAMGWNRRRRTISKLSSALAGRQEESIRPITFLRLAMACRPRSPPTSTSAVASSASEAGRLMTSRQLFANLADSDSA